MNIVNIEQISKVFGEKVIFDEASFGIQEGDRIGIIGINGTGKTTLLRMIVGLEEPDAGQIVRRSGLKIAWLPQEPRFSENTTVRSCVESCPEQWKVESILTRLGIDRYDTPVEQLSGGQKRKLALALVLAGDAELLIMDEPTNHLDEQMILWLEDYLKNYRGTLLMVTHDRYFLDKVTNRILEVSGGKMYGYEANYTRFLELKTQRQEQELAAERKRQSILRIELEWAKRGCRARSTKQRARLERLENLKNGQAPVRKENVLMDTIKTRMGKKTLELEHVGKRFGDQVILEDFSYIFLKNQKVGIVGPNGCGKSTFMKMLAGRIMPDVGEIQMGETIRVGYFAQEEQEMDENQRVIDYVREIGEYIHTSEGRISASRLLEQFLFTPDMQYSLIGKLSGGERRRLYLLGILAQNANVLLLDECSDSLDIPTLAVLEDYLNSFEGIVVAVSHDRYFLDNVADRILEFDGQGGIRQYEGGYTDYLEAREMPSYPAAPQVSKKEKKSTARDWKQNRTARLKFSFKEQKEYETIDGDIAALEDKVRKLDEEILENATNAGRLAELTIQKEEAEAQLEEKMDRWVYLNDLAEKIEAQKNA